MFFLNGIAETLLTFLSFILSIYRRKDDMVVKIQSGKICGNIALFSQHAAPPHYCGHENLQSGISTF